MTPQLPAVKQVLPDGVARHINGRQRSEIGVGDPNADRGVFLSQQLTTCNTVAVFSAQPLAKAELDGAEHQRGYCQNDDGTHVAFAIQEDKIYGLP